jgi:hypothetical protein
MWYILLPIAILVAFVIGVRVGLWMVDSKEKRLTEKLKSSSERLDESVKKTTKE